MQKVLDRYTKAIASIHIKAMLRSQGKFTPAQLKGIAYYRAAAELVQALIDAPTPEWVGVEFAKKSAF